MADVPVLDGLARPSYIDARIQQTRPLAPPSDRPPVAPPVAELAVSTQKYVDARLPRQDDVRAPGHVSRPAPDSRMLSARPAPDQRTVTLESARPLGQPELRAPGQVTRASDPLAAAAPKKTFEQMRAEGASQHGMFASALFGAVNIARAGYHMVEDAIAESEPVEDLLAMIKANPMLSRESFKLVVEHDGKFYGSVPSGIGQYDFREFGTMNELLVASITAEVKLQVAEVRAQRADIEGRMQDVAARPSDTKISERLQAVMSRPEYNQVAPRYTALVKAFEKARGEHAALRADPGYRADSAQAQAKLAEVRDIHSQIEGLKAQCRDLAVAEGLSRLPSDVDNASEMATLRAQIAALPTREQITENAYVVHAQVAPVTVASTLGPLGLPVKRADDADVTLPEGAVYQGRGKMFLAGAFLGADSAINPVKVSYDMRDQWKLALHANFFKSGFHADFCNKCDRQSFEEVLKPMIAAKSKRGTALAAPQMGGPRQLPTYTDARSQPPVARSQPLDARSQPLDARSQPPVVREHGQVTRPSLARSQPLDARVPSHQGPLSRQAKEEFEQMVATTHIGAPQELTARRDARMPAPLTSRPLEVLSGSAQRAPETPAYVDARRQAQPPALVDARMQATAVATRLQPPVQERALETPAYVDARRVAQPPALVDARMQATAVATRLEPPVQERAPGTPAYVDARRVAQPTAVVDSRLQAPADTRY